MATLPIRSSPRGVLVDVLVQPNASRSEIVGIHGDRIKVRITETPERLRANAAVIELLCGAVGVRRGEIVAGGTSRHKCVELLGADIATATTALLGGP